MKITSLMQLTAAATFAFTLSGAELAPAKPADFLFGNRLTEKDGVLSVSKSSDFYSKNRLDINAAKRYRLSGEFRHVNALEGILLTYGETKDSSLLEKAVSIYEKHNKKFTLRTDNEFELHWNKLSSGKNFALHGVTFSEEVKIPVLLYLYTGKNEYLAGAEKGLEKVLQRHEQIPGLPSSNEDFAGKDP